MTNSANVSVKDVFATMTLDELTAAYREINPKTAKNFKFANVASALKQVRFALMALQKQYDADPEGFDPELNKVLMKYNLLNMQAAEQAKQDEAKAAEAPAAEAADEAPAAEAVEPKAKAIKVPKTKDEIRAAISAGVAESWGNKDVYMARIRRNWCAVNGTVYSSLRKAARAEGWDKYALPVRKVVKIKKHVILTLEDGKRKEIILLGATGESLGAGEAAPIEIDVKLAPKYARTLSVASVSAEEFDKLMADRKAEAEAKAKLAEERAARKAEREAKAAEAAAAKAETVEGLDSKLAKTAKAKVEAKAEAEAEAEAEAKTAVAELAKA